MASLNRQIIVTYMEKKPMTNILNCASAKATWDKLTGIYESKSDASIKTYASAKMVLL